MSVERDVMQFLLDITRILANGATENAQIGRTFTDKLSESQIPFIRVFAAVQDISEEVAQQPGTLTFVVEILDKRGQKDALREVLEGLATTLAIDSSFQGLIRKGFVSEQALAETGDDKRIIASATVVCQFYDAQSETITGDAISTAKRDSFVNIVNFATQVNFTPTNCEIEDSNLVQGMLGVRRSTPSSATIFIEANTTNGGLPITNGISLAGVQKLRTTTYMTPEYGKAFITACYVQLFVETALTNGAGYQPPVEDFQTGIGWQEWIASLDVPTITFGTGLGDRSAIRSVRWFWSMFFSAGFSSTRFGLLLAKSGYHLRDRGSNAAGGFHADLIGS